MFLLLLPLLGIVDVPNAVATLAIPLSIFNCDVRPKGGAVLEALAKGVSVKKLSPSQAGESDVAAKPIPMDKRLPTICPPCKSLTK